MEYKDFGGFSAKYICEILPERNSNGNIVEHYPHNRYRNTKGLALHKDGLGPFCKFRIPRNLLFEGAYVLTVNAAVRYVGKCVRLSDRFNMGYGQISPRNCFNHGQSTNCRINRHIFEAAGHSKKIDLWFVETEERELVELSLISRMKPEWNVQHTS